MTMKILALNGSARKKGNTDILIDQILKGSKEVEMLRLSFDYLGMNLLHFKPKNYNPK